MTMYQAIAYLSSTGMSREQITDIIHSILDEIIYIQGKEARWYAMCQMNDFYNFKEREEHYNETNK